MERNRGDRREGEGSLNGLFGKWFCQKKGALNSNLVSKSNQIADGIWLGLVTILGSVTAMGSVLGANNDPN